MLKCNRRRTSSLNRLQQLEDRLAPAGFVVTNAGDNGDDMSPIPGSFRAAVVGANKFPDPDTISFNLPGPSMHVSYLSGSAGFGQLTLDGTTQPGYSGTPLVDMSDIFVSASGSSTVRGVILNELVGSGGTWLVENNNIRILGLTGVGSTISNNVVPMILQFGGKDNKATGNVAGVLQVAGTDNIVGGTGAGQGNVVNEYMYVGPGSGILIQGNSVVGPASDGIIVYSTTGVTIGGASAAARNIIGAHSHAGIVNFDGSTPTSNLTIQGNFIGTDATGNTALPNGIGIDLIGADGCVIDGNVISGNDVGIRVEAMTVSSPVGTKIQGNMIGVNAAGDATLPNTMNGVEILDANLCTIVGNTISANGKSGIVINANSTFGNHKVQGNFIGTNKAGTAELGNGASGLEIIGTKNNLIGGTAEGAGNIISANSEYGISIKSASTVNTIQGNRIGTDLFGTVGFGNGFSGINILGGSGNIIGGSATGARNLISANTGSGISIGSISTDNTIQGNYIGTGGDGTSKLGNQAYGVYVWGVSSKNKIGGAGTGRGNVIAYNGSLYGRAGHGIEIQSGTGNAIRSNSIFSNAGRGIDLNFDSFDINDPNGENPLDATKANHLQDYPVVVGRAQGPASDGKTTWRFNSTPNSLFTIEFFANDEMDPSGFGEGKEFLASFPISTDGNGDAGFSTTFPGKLLISSTATDSAGNTSEFSMIDTDADGLADAWEMPVGPIFKGVDVNEDGVPDLDLHAMGADPMHKDVFVEVDGMLGRAPAQADLDLVASDPAHTAGFAFAPDSLVHNPDQTAGINLHAFLDEPDLTVRDYTNAWVDFKTDKDAHFGTAIQRGSTNWPRIKTALELTHRYCIFAQRFNGTKATGLAELSAQDWGSNDFMVTVRPPDPSIGYAGSWGGPTGLDRAGTFMHELGHTLGLHHGGGDDINRKPNYRSVMNYNWQVPNVLRRTLAPGLDDYSADWRLDYSRQALPDLNESNLKEPDGIGGQAFVSVPYGAAVIPDPAHPEQVSIVHIGLATEAGPVDWNFANGPVDNPVPGSIDINLDGVVGQILTGHEDWSGLKFYFVESEYYNSSPGTADLDTDDISELAPPKVASVTVNDGSAQRSRVTSITVAFDSVVSLPAMSDSAFQLKRQSDGKLVDLSAKVATTALQTIVTLTFSGSATDFGSLADGRYTLGISAGSVSNVWGSLDGDGNGSGGDDYVLVGNTTNKLFRLFGDSDGNGTVNTVDFLAFRSAFGGTSSIFDFNNNGAVDSNDFLAFRSRFGSSV